VESGVLFDAFSMLGCDDIVAAEEAVEGLLLEWLIAEARCAPDEPIVLLEVGV